MMALNFFVMLPCQADLLTAMTTASASKLLCLSNSSLLWSVLKKLPGVVESKGLRLARSGLLLCKKNYLHRLKSGHCRDPLPSLHLEAKVPWNFSTPFSMELQVIPKWLESKCLKGCLEGSDT